MEILFLCVLSIAFAGAGGIEDLVEECGDSKVMNWKNLFEQKILNRGYNYFHDDAVEDYRISRYDIADLKAIMEDIRVEVPMSTYVFDESGQEKESSLEVPMIISMGLSMIIYLFVMMFSGW